MTKESNIKVADFFKVIDLTGKRNASEVFNELLKLQPQNGDILALKMGDPECDNLLHFFTFKFSCDSSVLQDGLLTFDKASGMGKAEKMLDIIYTHNQKYYREDSVNPHHNE